MKRLALAAIVACLATPALAQSTTRPSAASAVSGGLVLKTGTAIVAGVNVVSGASAGFVMLFDAASVPADGAVAPLRCMPLAANTGIDLNWRSAPLYLQTGAVIVFSTTGCFSKTASATAFIAGDIR